MKTWTPITEQWPKDKVLLLHLKYPQGGSEYRLAIWYSARKHEADTDYDSEWADYDEENDMYYCPEGWYEKGASHEDIKWWQTSDTHNIVAWLDFERFSDRAMTRSLAEIE